VGAAAGGGEALQGAVTARGDLAARVLRVLHDRSFVDDPTRMLRLVRYAHRLDFRVEPHTAALVDPERLGTVSGDRLGAELRLLMAEGVLGALGALGPALLPGFAPPPALPRSPLAALAACCTRVPGLPARLDALGFTARDRKIVVAAAHAARTLDLAGASAAQLWLALRRLPPEAAEVIAAGDGPAAEAAQRWFDDVRHRALEITGDDLVAAGLSGAAVGAGLQAAMVAMLEGRAPDRAAQLAAALSAEGRLASEG
jgi:tRNA nucleotidyltransferase (CCA-adding enzyme)